MAKLKGVAFGVSRIKVKAVDNAFLLSQKIRWKAV